MAPQANQDKRSVCAGDCDRCANSMRLHALAERLARLGLASRVVTCPADEHDDEHAEQIVVTNPAAPERGELRISDDASVTWEYSGTFDGDGSGTILDEAINALRATGLRLQRGESR
jgi:1-aminocyclopropane-1-carboxylate deaminase/D-cysteine desulfhydrase-like pyridoxal-dependent ACC family enzyme